MISNHGRNVLNEEYGVFVDVTKILYLEGAVTLEGLTSIKRLPLFIRNHKPGATIRHGSKFQVEIIKAVTKLISDFNNEKGGHSFAVLDDCTVINVQEICIVYRDNEGPAIRFNDGSMVRISMIKYNTLINTVFRNFEDWDKSNGE